MNLKIKYILRVEKKTFATRELVTSKMEIYLFGKLERIYQFAIPLAFIHSHGSN